jgi:hypothetical protein
MDQFRNSDFGEKIVFVPNISFAGCKIQLINWWKWIGDNLVIVDISAHAISNCICEISAHSIEHIVGSMYYSIQTVGI